MVLLAPQLFIKQSNLFESALLKSVERAKAVIILRIILINVSRAFELPLRWHRSIKLLHILVRELEISYVIVRLVYSRGAQ